MNTEEKIDYEGKHLFFIILPQDPQRKTKVWRVLNKYDNILLGEVRWFSRWCKYAFFPSIDTIFEEDCLRDIANLCENKTKQHNVGFNKQKENESYLKSLMRHG